MPNGDDMAPLLFLIVLGLVPVVVKLLVILADRLEKVD